MTEERTVIRKNIKDLIAEPKRSSAYVIVLSGQTSVGKMFKLDRAEMTLGRAGDCDIMLDDEGVSRKHAKIVARPDGSVQLMDLNSTNGTFNNGEKVEVAALQDGDKIQIGTATILKFSYQDALDEKLQQNLYESATRDGLTHLYNKKYFVDTLRKEFAYCVRHRMPLSLLILDIDHFKRINDTYGHQAGDYVLARFASEVGKGLRTEDLFARYGGEEFVVLLRETDEEKAFILGERLRRIIEGSEFAFNGQKIKVTFSAGISTLGSGEHNSPEDFIEAADKLLYRAKQSGRNRVEAQMLKR